MPGDGERAQGQRPSDDGCNERGAGSDGPAGDTEAEARDVEEHSRLKAPVIYEIVRREGENEMERPTASLWWSGLAAGLSISFSLLAEAILQLHLPAAPWRPLVAGFGYSFGFLVVVLGRQQLFTENTVTVVLPVAAELTWANMRRLLRMWAIVFFANTAGTLFAAIFCSFAPVIDTDLRSAMFEISRQMMENGPVAMFFKAISAGFLIAAMVWLIPSAEGTQFHVVTVVTYLIAIGGFVHIVAGGVEAFMLVVTGQLGFGQMLVGFTIPALCGNVIGGTALFALISYAQVMHEI
jgi:formate/nitrite transporter FocA (FNT family)